MPERSSRSSCEAGQVALFEGKTETGLAFNQHRTFQPRRGTVRLRLGWVAVAPARQTRTCLINGYGGLGWITKSGEFQSSRYIKKGSTRKVTRPGRPRFLLGIGTTARAHAVDAHIEGERLRLVFVGGSGASGKGPLPRPNRPRGDEPRAC